MTYAPDTAPRRSTRWPRGMTCPWLIKVASGNPEPDFPEDLVRIVECGASVEVNEFGSWRCEAGHEHVSFGDPARAAFEVEEAFRERHEEGVW